MLTVDAKTIRFFPDIYKKMFLEYLCTVHKNTTYETTKHNSAANHKLNI